MAPFYGTPIDDAPLLERLNRIRPQHVIVTIGGGNQERLGLYLKRNLDFLPAIHCIGAAIAFLSGDQVNIPVWADKFYLGWLFRSLSEPKRYMPRYWGAFRLFPLMLRNRANPSRPALPTAGKCCSSPNNRQYNPNKSRKNNIPPVDKVRLSLSAT
jgi:UDP-N-acetyl-D-mannosaminuronic acid transferase (WecB/TagA/CpsF family)